MVFLAGDPQDWEPIQRITKAERDRARRTRRLNFRTYLLIWVCAFAYAVWALLDAPTLGVAFDQFLPLQIVAGIAALAVFFCGRRLRRRTISRWLSLVPVGFTVVGLTATVALVLLAGFPNDRRPGLHVEPTRTVSFAPYLVSL